MAHAPGTKPAGSKRSDAYERILSAIIFGDLAEGSSVDEKQIAKTFGLGLAVVRDALARLALEGMVERHARIGTRVPELSLREMHEVFETRVIVEGAAAALAAQRRSRDDVEALQKAFTGIEDAIAKRDFRRVVAMDLDFHHRLAMATKNSHIQRSLVLLHNNSSRFWYFGLQRLDPNEIRRDIETHFEVVDAIAAQNAEAAALAMRKVIGVFPDSMRLFMGSTSPLPDGQMPAAALAVS